MKPGNVPTERIAPILYTLIRERWPHGGGMDVLAEKVGCDPSVIAHIIDQTNPGVEFDLADKLLCGLGRFDHWFGQLADIYPTKFRETCALPSCNRKFPETKSRYTKQYCSRRCMHLGHRVKDGSRPGTRMRKRNRCLKGHLLTPENTLLWGGQKRCRVCRHEFQSSPEYKARRRDQRARRKVAVA